MRKIVCMLCALVMCLSLACPAFAAANTFVPSITYKDAPDLDEAVQDGKDVSGCLVITTVEDALKSAGRATEAARGNSSDATAAEKELLDVYDKLKSGAMKLPQSGNYVVRELINVCFHPETCVGANHGHKEWLDEQGNCINLTFDLGVSRQTEVKVLVCQDGQWTPAESVTNNGNGSVSCELENIGTLAFCIEDISDAPQTGDSGMMLWVGILVASAAAVVVLLLLRRKGYEKK